MDHFRGSQPPASHSVPGAQGLPDHPPHIGAIGPLAFIPAAFLNDILATIRNEFSRRDWDIRNRYSSITQGYSEMAEEFKRSVQQTDKILLEQHSRFELRLREIRNDMRQSHNSQMTTLTMLKERLDALEVLTEASRNAMDSRITTVIETMEHGFGAAVKNNGYGESLHLGILKSRQLICDLVYRCPSPSREWSVRVAGRYDQSDHHHGDKMFKLGTCRYRQPGRRRYTHNKPWL